LSLRALYDRKIAAGDLKPDGQQRTALRALERLYGDLMKPAPKRLFGLDRLGLGKREPAPRGVYLYGGVGRGKSMLMDLFYSSLPQDFPKRRVHFHAFMIGVHEALNRARLENNADRGLPDYAKAVAAKVRILCFDEFHVTDVADAMILSRLFTALFEQGVAVVATSNWEPDRLYEGGLQRDRFLPFIALVKQRMDVVPLTGGLDYRLQTLADTGVYFSPLGDGARGQADALFAKLTDRAHAHQDVLQVRGRDIIVQAAVGHIARFSFAQLCERPMGAEDYLEIARAYHTVFLEGVPKMGYDRRNEAKRLMILIDALYESHTRLIVTADARPEKLYVGHDHAFEFQRTVSRLIEMQSVEYLEKQKETSSAA
jgi:cell division protein ZapE